MWKVSADPLQFEEAVAWFLERVPLPKDAWDTLEEEAKRRAFTVAGVAQLDVIESVWETIYDALSDDTPYIDFQESVREKLLNAWDGTVKNPGHRIETIFRTNTQQAYSSGRWKQMSEPAVKSARPFWMFDAVLDDRTTEEICRPLNGTVLPADDPFWATHRPPLHFSCRSTIRSLTRKAAEEKGVAQELPQTTVQKGFGHAPGKHEWKPNPSDYPPELWRAYERKHDE
jgi:SPP1 gp7 family putative phage head morphogenesis protein